MLGRTVLLALIAFVVSVLSSTDAMASAQRTFVASYGSPANTAFNCSITKPCRAFSEALSVTTAGGEVIVLDSAGYGPMTITQTVSIIAPPGVYAGIRVSSGNGVTVNAPGASVTLRGLTIVGVGGGDFGINAIGGSVPTGLLRIERCTIKGMTGIGLAANPVSLVILDSTFEENGTDGIQGGGSDALVERTRSAHNGGIGIWVDGGRAVIRDSTFAYNAFDGVYAPNSHLTLENSEVTHNYRGVVSFTASAFAALLSISRSNISHNTMEGVLMGSVVATPPLPMSHGSITDTVVHNNGTYGINAVFGQMIVSNVTVTSNGSYGLCGGPHSYTRTNNIVFDNNGGGVQVCGLGLVPLPPV